MRFITALALLGCAFAAPSENNPLVPMLDGKIVGGSTVSITKFPYQLSLRVGGSHVCGASIISTKWAVTAAHCVVGMSASNINLRAGSSFHASGGTLHRLLSFTYHKKYNSKTIDYDIAVLRVRSPFKVGASGVNRIRLPSDGYNPKTGTKAIVSGWGTLSSGSGSIPSQLQAVTVPIVSQSSCKSSYGSSSITIRMVCAGFPAGGKDSCQGDSGGPLVIGNKLVGIVSWGKGCASAGYPGVYSNVGNLRSWIRQQTRV